MENSMLSLIASVLNKFLKNNEKELPHTLEKILERTSIKLFQTQIDILLFLYHSSSKFKAIEAPTGTGKTITYIIYSLSKEHNFDHIIFSTFTKNLQQQIYTEFHKFSLDITPLVIFGKSNYICPDKLSLLPEKEQEIITRLKPRELLKKVAVTSYYCSQEYRKLCPHRKSCEYVRTLNQIENSKFLIVNHFLLPHILRRLDDRKILLVIDECHQLLSRRTIHIEKEDLLEPEKPSPENFGTIQEFNLAYEKYMIQLQKYRLAKKYNIQSPGRYEIPANFDFSSVKEVIFFSATMPETLPENCDLLQVEDKTDWSNVRIIVKDTNYRKKGYLNVLRQTIKKATGKYSRVIVLATSHQQLRKIREMFPDAATTLDEKPFTLIEKLKSGEVKLAAGTDVFWTGIDVPGRKCIIMTKLPFPSPENSDEEISFVTGMQIMLKKFKQGMGRMLRSSRCCGEIFVLDNRIQKFPEVIDYLQSLSKKGATVIFENKRKENTQNLRLRVVK